MSNTLNILDATKIALHFVEKNGEKVKVLQIKPNTVKTIRADFMVFIYCGYGKLFVLFMSKVPKNDLLNHNSQFDKNFIAYYYTNHEVCFTKSFCKSLNKYVIINARRSLKQKLN